jgi:hypothetical protein
VLAAALAAGAVGVSAEALASFRHLDRANRSWRDAEVSVALAQGVNPAVLARVAAAVPPSATYESWSLHASGAPCTARRSRRSFERDFFLASR